MNLDLLNKMRMEKASKIESPKWLIVIYGDESHGKKSNITLNKQKYTIVYRIPYIDSSTKVVWIGGLGIPK